MKQAFTLAEVLITLIVTGVVAAITVPMLHNDASDKKWNVARQKAQASIGEAFRLMTVNGEIDENISTENFVKKIIPKYLKIEKTCSPNDYKNCGFPSKVKTPSGAVVSLQPNEWKWTTLSHPKVINESGNVVTYSSLYGEDYNTNYFFRTLDGFSVSFFYNPHCVSKSFERRTENNGPYQMSLDITCLMGVYDMNGASGPNQVGKDIGFIGSFYNGYSVKSATILPHSSDPNMRSLDPAGNCCRASIAYCENLDKDKNWVLPDINEYSLMFLNLRLISKSGNFPVYSGNPYFFSRTPSSFNEPNKFEHINMNEIYGGHIGGV